MDEMFNRMPRWFLLLLAVAMLALGVDGLFSGVVETPSSYAFLRQDLSRATQPLQYWSLLLAYLAGGGIFLAAALRRYRQPEDSWEPPPPAPRPRGLLRALAWLGVGVGVLMVGAGVVAHFMMDPIIGLFFVAGLVGGGLMIGLAGAGYLVTGRLQ